jgi:hypothetical protein
VENFSKKYMIRAKRKNEKVWTPWTSLDDKNEVGKLVKKVEELGYDVKVVCDDRLEVRYNDGQ